MSTPQRKFSSANQKKVHASSAIGLMIRLVLRIYASDRAQYAGMFAMGSILPRHKVKFLTHEELSSKGDDQLGLQWIPVNPL